MNALSLLIAGPVPMTRQAQASSRTHRICTDSEDVADMETFIKLMRPSARVLSAMQGRPPMAIYAVSKQASMKKADAHDAIHVLHHFGILEEVKINGYIHPKWRLTEDLCVMLERADLRPEMRQVLCAAIELHEAAKGSGDINAGNDQQNTRLTVA